MGLSLIPASDPTIVAGNLDLAPNAQRDYGASGLATTFTGTIAAGSTTLTLNAPWDGTDGQGIFIQHAGSPCANATPTAVSVAASGTTGTTAYTYAALALDDAGGYSASTAYVTIANGNATLSATNFNSVTVTPDSGNPSAPVAVYGGVSGSPLQYLGALQVVWYGYTFADNGAPRPPAPSYLPATLPAAGGVSGASGWLSTSIASGAGSTTVTLSTVALTTVSDDTVRHDDTQALQNWLNALTNTGVLPEGTYNVSTSPTLQNGTQITLRGEGPTSQLSPLPGTEANALELLDCTQCTVQGVYVAGNKTNVMPVATTRYHTLAGIYVRGCTTIRVTDCHVTASHMGGITVEGSTDVHIADCTATDCDDNGIFGRPGNTGFTVRGCRSTGGKFNGITCIRGTAVLFDSNTAYGNGNEYTQEGAGLDFEGCLNSAMTGNLSYGNLVQGIKVDYTVEGGTTAQRSQTIALTGNVCTGQTQTVTPNGITINSMGILVQNADVVRTSGNLVAGNYQGVNVGSVTDFDLHDFVYDNVNLGINLFQSSASTATAGPGHVGGISADNGAAGVYNAAISNVTYTGVFRGSTGATGAGEGLQLSAGTRHRVVGAVLFDNSDNGILVSNSATDVVVRGCTFSNTTFGSQQGRALYEASGAGPTVFVQNYVEGQVNQPFFLSNASSYATGNIGGAPMGWIGSAPSLPAGTGSSNAVTNAQPMAVRVYLTGNVGTHVIDPNGTDVALPSDPPEVTLSPGAKIYFATTIPSAWQWYRT